MKNKRGKITPTAMLVNIFAFFVVLAVKTEAVDYSWSALLKNSESWFGGAEASAIADSIVKYQRADGGWRKSMDNLNETGEWEKSTTDNDATTSQITFLARVYKRTNTAKYLASLQKGVDLLINGQYANGGWPQVFGASSGSYHTHITYNDGAMVRVLNIMKAVSEKSGDFTFIDDTRASPAKTAVEKGINCILNTQIIFKNGEKNAWCQQHNATTLAPAPARAYELPSVSGSESVGIVNFLKSYHNSLGDNPRLDIVRSVNAAVIWMDKVKIEGIKVNNITTNGEPDRVVVTDPSSTLWARFYELETNNPIFVGRDGVIKYSLADIEQERRAGYAYYGNWPKDLVGAGLVKEPRDTLNGTLVKSLVIFDGDRYSSWSIRNNLRVGDTIYGDREFTFTSVPDAARGLEWIRTACDSKNFSGDAAKFTAAENITVFVGVDTRVSQNPTWLDGWVNTGYTASASNDGIVYRLYKKEFNKGSAVTLGGNGVSSGVVMYTVFVAPRSTSSVILNSRPIESARIAVSGKKLNVTAAAGTVLRIRIVDMRGKTTASFTANGGGAFSLSGQPAGRYVAEVKESGKTAARFAFILNR